jgi:hypothetical protein
MKSGRTSVVRSVKNTGPTTMGKNNMRQLTKQILRSFDDHFLPQEIGVAEVIASRFIAGESISYIAADYDKSRQAIIAAIRFFYLKARGNKTVMKVCDDYYKRKLGIG